MMYSSVGRVKGQMTKTATGKDAYKSKDQWYLVDGEGQVMGRLASRIAMVLMGKHQPGFTRHVDTGGHVVVINADKVKVTGKKMTDKTYSHYSGYPSGLKVLTMERLIKKHPTAPLKKAVEGMLPKSHLGYSQAKKLKLYVGAEHPHKAQTLEALK